MGDADRVHFQVLGTHLSRITLAHLRVAPMVGSWADVKPENRLYFVLNERGRYGSLSGSLGPRNYPLSARHILHVPPQSYVECHYGPGLRLLAFHVSAEILPGLDLFCGEKRFHSFRSEPLIRRARAFARRGTAADALEAHALCGEALACVFRDHGGQPTPSAPGDGIERVLDCLKANPFHGVRVESLAREAGVDRGSLSRMFKARFGIRTKEFLDRLVLTESQRLLMATDDSVRQISHRLRFPNEFFFSGFFKRRTGRSPTQWREDFRRMGILSN